MPDWEVMAIGEGMFASRCGSARARSTLVFVDEFRGTGMLATRLVELLGEEVEVIRLDLRGCGQNAGGDLSWGLHEVGDVERVVAATGSGRPLVLAGVSIGAAVATLAAARLQPALLVAASPYDTFGGAAPALLRNVVGMSEAMISFHLELLQAQSPPSPLAAAPGASCAAIFLAGQGDRVVPLERTRRVADAWGGDSQLWELDADHGEVMLAALDGRRRELCDRIRAAGASG